MHELLTRDTRPERTARASAWQDAAMLAAVAGRIDSDNPLAALELREVTEPDPREGWEIVEVRAAALNRHDWWTLRGVGVTDEFLPVVLGCDAAGVAADGREVVVHAVLSTAAPGEDGVHRVEAVFVNGIRQVEGRDYLIDGERVSLAPSVNRVRRLSLVQKLLIAFCANVEREGDEVDAIVVTRAGRRSVPLQPA